MGMYQQTYFMSKSTGTIADVLATYGTAAVLDELLRQNLPTGAGRKVRIRDVGTYYAIELDRPVKADWVEACSYFSLVPFVQTRKVRAEDIPHVIDYEEEWERFRAYQTVMKGHTDAPEGGRNHLNEIAEDLRPTLTFWVSAYLGERRMQALPAYDSLAVRWWETRTFLRRNVEAILELASSPYVDSEEVARRWAKDVKVSGVKKTVTASQLINPHQGKGQNQPKANHLKMDNQPSFWLVEYLKAAGLWLSAAPRVIRESDNRKTYIIAPTSITLGTHLSVFKTFSERLWSDSAVKMDIVASLLYTECLLEYSEAGQFDELDFEGYGPENVVSGFHVAYYKLLSRNAYTMMNQAFLGLPRWVGNVKNREDVLALKDVISEHLGVVRGINEEQSDGYRLLEHYRDFLSASDWSIFFQFTAGYSQYLMGELIRGRTWVRPFTTKNMEVLLMGSAKPLAPIIQNQGFRNIAEAIRRSTIIPQYLGRDKNEYEVRYGLGQELKRHAHYNDEFIAALAEFMQSYNAENARVYEKVGKQMRRNVQVSDIEDVVKLVDEYGARVVCDLLVAFGYARDPKAEEAKLAN